MWGPLVVLAVGAALAGVCLDWSFFHGPNWFAEFLALTPSLAGGPIAATAQPGEFHSLAALRSILFAAGGILAAVYFYLGGLREVRRLRWAMDFRRLAGLQSLRWTSRLTGHRWAVAVGRGAQSIGFGWLAWLLGRLLLVVLIISLTPLLLAYQLSPYKLSRRKFFFDELYDVLAVKPLRAAAWVSYAVDRWVVDGLVDLCGRTAPAMGWLLRFLQIGLVQFYALAMVVGVLILIAARLFWASG
jgi:hypothetical protein